MSERRCETCRWWNAPRGQVPWGQCRMKAPGPAPYQRDDVKFVWTAAWPFVGSTDWCGEHQPGPDAGEGE